MLTAHQLHSVFHNFYANLQDIPSQILNSLTEEEEDEEDEEFANTCPSASHLFKGTINYAQDLRNPLKNMVERLCPRPFQRFRIY